MDTKMCSKCRKVKPADEFGLSRSYPDGLYYLCKECANERQREWRRNNPVKSSMHNRRAYMKRNVDPAMRIKILERRIEKAKRELARDLAELKKLEESA